MTSFQAKSLSAKIGVWHLKTFRDGHWLDSATLIRRLGDGPGFRDEITRNRGDSPNGL